MTANSPWGHIAITNSPLTGVLWPAGIKKQIEAILPKEETKDRNGITFRNRLFSSTFANKQAENLRLDFVHMNGFREASIALIKSGEYRDFELYDLTTDPGQQTNVAVQHPEIVRKLSTQLLEIYGSVMADGPNWQLEP